jgi:hypothetical protein
MFPITASAVLVLLLAPAAPAQAPVPNANPGVRGPRPGSPAIPPKNLQGRHDKVFDRFSKAVEGYRTAVTSNASVEKPLKELKDATSELRHYRFVNWAGASKVDKAAYANLPRAELLQQTLKAADVVKADLQGVVKLEQNPSLLRDREAMVFIHEFRAEVDRLAFLISKGPTKNRP